MVELGCLSSSSRRLLVVAGTLLIAQVVEGFAPVESDAKSLIFNRRFQPSAPPPSSPPASWEVRKERRQERRSDRQKERRKERREDRQGERKEERQEERKEDKQERRSDRREKQLIRKLICKFTKARPGFCVDTPITYDDYDEIGPHTYDYETYDIPVTPVDWTGCNWIRTNEYTNGEYPIGEASTPNECIAMATSEGCEIANINEDGFGSCWCQFGQVNPDHPDVDASYYSCDLTTGTPVEPDDPPPEDQPDEQGFCTTLLAQKTDLRAFGLWCNQHKEAPGDVACTSAFVHYTVVKPSGEEDRIFQLCTVSEDGTCKVENLSPFADYHVGEFCDDSCLESPYPDTCENEGPECCDPDISPILCSPCETVLELEAVREELAQP